MRINAKSKIFVITNIFIQIEKYLFVHKYKKNYIHIRIYIHYSFIYSNIGYIHHITYAYGFFVDIDKQSDKNDIDRIIHKN